ncbi:radical SAM protein [Rhodoblastus sp.]|uniref:radical SAM protein n=1 Tax=Rhodoblastus sp. TaxID=1962975 RepID=UPI00261D037B|nr:radical SAM protein [Rhodoblastus sp.]
MLAAFQRRLFSTAGEPGLANLADRAQIWLGPLSEAWQARNAELGISPLADVLVDAITSLDNYDLRPTDVRLRPPSGGKVPVGVVSKFTRALIEYLAEGDDAAERKALESLAGAGHSLGRFEFELGFRAALAEFLIEQRDYDLAVAAINENLKAHSTCPYSEHILYRALLKQKEAGTLTDAPSIGLHDMSDRFCDQPFVALSTLSARSTEGGDASWKAALHACRCPAMLPYPIAGFPSNLTEGQESEDVWNGPEVQEIRRSIHDGDFTYCNRKLCFLLVNDSLPRKDEVTDPVLRDIIDNKRTHISTPPRLVLLAHDAACNLACPSCRTELITTKNEARQEMDSFADRIILPLLDGAKVDLWVAGDGDPFGSKHYRRLLSKLDPVRNGGVRLFLQTNGLLLTPKEWDSLSSIHNLITGVCVSIDAAEPATYEDVRRPGKWSTITANMDLLASLRRAGKISYLNISMVVQKKNYEQIPAFVELGQHWAADNIQFIKLYGHTDDYQSNAVVDESHPEHQRFLEVLKHPILRSKEVDLFNIASYLDAPAGQDNAPCKVVSINDNNAAPAPVEAPAERSTFWELLFPKRKKRAATN